MFKIKQYCCEKTNQNDIEISNSETPTFAIIQLNQGARLKELILSDYHIIKEMDGLEYTKTYASSILFPFANRIKDGCYEFENKMYQFPINEKELNNALHGLVFNEEFEVLETDAKEDCATVTFCYIETQEVEGFPFSYVIKLKYTITNKTLNLAVELKNTDSKTFPFTLGWHPYFFSSDRFKSSVIFDSNEKLILNDRCITEGVEVNDNFGLMEIRGQSLDDCYILRTSPVTFKTPEYVLTIDSSEKENFLQLYTPPHPNMIAIEPTTGVSDSFNNGIGLKTLKPNDIYKIEWYLILENS